MSKIVIGKTTLQGRAWLAPMTGVSDLPFRRTAARLGASYMATEMVACAELAKGRPDVVRRAAVGEGLPVMVVQLVGRDPRWIAEGARMAALSGAQIIDLNFGCPAKEVTGAQCGSALMRDLDLAETLIGAAVDACDVPITVKMRLGWDEDSRNAAELAQRAEQRGAKAVTVHGRTRRQFYNDTADWSAVSEVKKAVGIPVVVNGDIVDAASAREAIQRSGADAVMIGRGAYGRPWIARAIESALDGRSPPSEPGPSERLGIVLDHLSESLSFYGERLGLKIFRKHLGWYVEAAPWPRGAAERRAAKSRLCRLATAREVVSDLTDLWSEAERMAA